MYSSHMFRPSASFPPYLPSLRRLAHLPLCTHTVRRKPIRHESVRREPGRTRIQLPQIHLPQIRPLKTHLLESDHPKTGCYESICREPKTHANPFARKPGCTRIRLPRTRTHANLTAENLQQPLHILPSFLKLYIKIPPVIWLLIIAFQKINVQIL